jgi:hypothetical protein
LLLGAAEQEEEAPSGPTFRSPLLRRSREGIGEHQMMVFSAEQLALIQEQLDDEEGPIPDPSLERF